MKLCLITGKTTYFACKNAFLSLKNELNKQTFVIVPDRFTLQAEKLLFETLNIQSSFSLNVMSLSRFAEMHIKTEKQKQNVLKSVLLIKKLLDENVNKLLYYKKASVKFAYEVYKNIMQIKSSGLNFQTFTYKGNNLSLKNKVKDISLIFEQFEEKNQENLDSTDVINLITNQLGENNFKDKKIVFAMFDSFTESNFLLIKECVKNFEQTVISTAVCEQKGGNFFVYEGDIFEKIKKTASQLNVEVEVVSPFQDLTVEQNLICDNLFSFNSTSQKCEFLNVSSASSVEEEIEYFAKLINYNVYNGERFKNFAISVSNIEEYKEQIEKIFNEYEIPINMDTEEKIEGFLFEFLKILINLKIKNFTNEDLLFVFSSPLIEVDDKASLIASINEKKLCGAEIFYRNLLFKSNIIANFVKGLSECKTFKDFSCHILLLIDGVTKNFEKHIEKLSGLNMEKEISVNTQSLTAIKEVLSLLDSNDSVSLQDYISFFEIGVSIKNISALPSFCDAVFVGDSSSTYFSEVDNLIVLGANSGEMPRISYDTGLLSDEELRCLKLEKKVEPTIKMINRRNRFKLFNDLVLAKKKLFVSFLTLDSEGKSISKAMFVDSLMEIFEESEVVPVCDISYMGIDQNSQRLIFDLGGKTKTAIKKLIACLNDESFNKSQLASLQNVLKYDFKKLYLNKKQLKTENLKQFFFKNNRFSVSQIERFYDCPFKHYVDYGLRLKSKKTETIDKLDFGKIIHEVLECFANQNKENLENISKDNVKSFVKSFVENLINEKYSHVENIEFQKKLIVKEAVGVVEKFLYEQRNSSYKIYQTEKAIFDNFVFDGETLALKGQVDRVDFGNDGVRIIDYKTGSINVNMYQELFYGKKIQLFMYSKVLGKTKRVEGLYYFSAKSSLPTVKNPVLQGITRKDCIANVDKRFIGNQDFKSDIIERKKGCLNEVKAEQLSTLENYAVALSKNAIKHILKGRISAFPSVKSCEVCDYKGICLHSAGSGLRSFSSKNLKSFTDEGGCDV